MHTDMIVVLMAIASVIIYVGYLSAFIAVT